MFRLEHFLAVELTRPLWWPPSGTLRRRPCRLSPSDMAVRTLTTKILLRKKSQRPWVSSTGRCMEFNEFKELLSLWPDLADEPLADPAYIGVYLISKHAKESGVTVMVSGDG